MSDAEGLGPTVIASGGGLSPIRKTNTVRTIDGIKNTASATASRSGRPNLTVKMKTTTASTKKARYEIIIVYTARILF